MTKAEFERLVKKGTLRVLRREPNGVDKAIALNGTRITLRPDLPGLPVTE